MRLAVLDDDPLQLEHLVHTLSHQLARPGETVAFVSFDRGESLRRAMRRETFDLLIVDWNLPDPTARRCCSGCAITRKMKYP
jgi:DNA-binding response OmpR family regulator